MAVDCGLVSKEFQSLYEGIDLWAKKNSTKEIFNDPFEAALKLINSNFNMELKTLRYIKDLTPGQVRGFLARLTELTGKVKHGDLDNNFAKFMWQGSHYGPKDPVIGNLLNDMQKVQFNMRANEVADKSDMKFIIDELKEESIYRNFEKSGMNEAERKRKRLKEMRIEAMVDYRNAELKKDLGARKEAENRLNKINKETDRLVRRTHLSVYDEMIKVIEVGIPEAVTKKYNELKEEAYTVTKKGKLKVKDKRKAARFERIKEHKEILRLDEGDIARLVVRPDGTPLRKSSPHLYNAVVTYQKLMGRLYKTLRLGINKRIDSVVERMEYLGQADSEDTRGMEAIRERMAEKYLPKYESGFYPHYVKTLNA